MLYRKGQTVFSEIHSQPKVWQEILQLLSSKSESTTTWLKSQNFGQVIYISTADMLNAANSVSRLTHLVSGLNSVVMPASEVMYERRPPYDSRIKTLIVCFSCQEVALELSWALEKMKAMDPKALVLTVEVGESQLAALSNCSIVLPSKDTTKIAITSVNTVMLTGFALISWLSGKQALWNELEKLPAILEDHLKEWQSRIQQLIMNKPTFITFLASGPFFGTANQAALTIREMSGLPAEANYFVEYRQGYYGCMTNQGMIVGLLSNNFRLTEEKVLRDLGITRAHRLAIAEQSSTDLMKLSDAVFELKSGVNEIARVLLLLPVIQLFSFYAAMSRGVNPDNPKHMDHPHLALKEKPGTKPGA